MRTIRTYLLTHSELGWQSSVHRDLESLYESWGAYSGHKDVTGVIHVGLNRPEYDSFDVCVELHKGRMILTASARWALMSVSECAPMIIGEAETIPFFVALNGWGYEASIEELGLVNPIFDQHLLTKNSLDHAALINNKELDSKVDSILLRSVNDFNLSPRPANCLREKGIFLIGDLIQLSHSDLQNLPNLGIKSLEEIKRLISSLNLASNKQSVQTQMPSLNSPSIVQSEYEDDPIAIIHIAPSWLLSVSLDDLNLQVRTFNALTSNGLSIVGDIADLTIQILLDIPNFGKTSLRDLAEQLKAAIKRSAFNSANQLIAGLKEVTSADILIDSSTILGSNFRGETLPLIIEAAVSSLQPNMEKVIRNRMGLNSADSMTLFEVGVAMNITRERVRQIEAKGLSLISRDSIWKHALEPKLAKLLDERNDPLPFSSLPIFDTWFDGVDQTMESFNYLLKHKDYFGLNFSILKINGQWFISRLPQDEWDRAVKQARLLLQDGVNHGWCMSESRSRVKDLLFIKGRELHSELWAAAKEFAYFSLPQIDGEPVLIGYGNSAEALVETVLRDSERPLHYSEISKRIMVLCGKQVAERQVHSAASKVAVFYGKGCYGFINHCLLNAQEMESVRDETLEIFSNGAIDRQWSCDELMNIFNEKGFIFDGRLNKYSLNIALMDSSDIKSVGRFLWQSVMSSNGTLKRIDIRQAVTSLLLQAGKPMSNSEIKEALEKDRGVSSNFQIFPSEAIILVGAGLWGLIERDLALNFDEQNLLRDILEKMLRDRNSGIHISEIAICLESVFEPASRIKDPVGIFAIALRSNLMSKSPEDYLFLSEWGEPRRIGKLKAIQDVLRQSDESGLTTNDIIRLTSGILGREVSRLGLSRLINLAGARLDEEKNRWITTNLVEDLDDEWFEL